MELDAINNKRPFSQKEKLPEVPELEAGIISQDEQNDEDNEDEEEEEEVFEEIGTPKEEIDSKIKTENANSAFDNAAATFYV